MKVGDLVKLVGEPSSRTPEQILTGIVTEINTTEGDAIDRMFPYRVDFFYGYTDWFGPDALELVSESR